jgi:hypothetical protein
LRTVTDVPLASSVTSLSLVLLVGVTTMTSWPDALCEAIAPGWRHVVRYTGIRLERRRSWGPWGRKPRASQDLVERLQVLVDVLDQR